MHTSPILAKKKKKQKYKFVASYSWVDIYYNVWESVKTPTTAGQADLCQVLVSVPLGNSMRKSRADSHGCCRAILVQQAGVLPPYPHRILPAWRKPRSQNKSGHATQLQISWHNTLPTEHRAQSSHCPLHGFTSNQEQEMLCLQTILRELYPWAAIITTWNTPFLSIKAPPNLAERAPI